MTQDDRQYLKGCIKKEGFDYCFRHYSSFEEINDQEFQRLLEIYRQAARKLEQYIEDEEVYNYLYNLK